MTGQSVIYSAPTLWLRVVVQAEDVLPEGDASELLFVRRFPEFEFCIEADSHQQKWEPGESDHKQFGPIIQGAVWDYSPSTELRNGNFLKTID